MGHPPLAVTGRDFESTDEPRVVFLHAALWLVVEPEGWTEHRSGHVHVVWTEEDPRLRLIDLAGHPLRQCADVASRPVEEMSTQLRESLKSWDLRLFRIAELGIVSELGEGREAFRRRALGLLRPEVQRRIDEIASRPEPRMPWRRRARKREAEVLRSELGSSLARLAATIEEWRSPDPAAAVSRAELGMLLVPRSVSLTPAVTRDLML